MTRTVTLMGEHITETDGSYCVVEYLSPKRSQGQVSPTVICFHGSGIDQLPSWRNLLESMSELHQTVFFERGLQNPSPQTHVGVLWNYLTRQSIQGPYILVAHSYGGVFAKHFLHDHPETIAGMILVETAKSNTPEHILTALMKKNRLRSKPLSVIRGNMLLQQWQSVKASSDSRDVVPEVLKRQKWLEHCDEADERLEKEQLKLSDNSRYVNLPDCGHHVIRDMPEVVLQELKWALDQHESSPPITSVPWLRRAWGLFSTKRIE